MLLNVLVGLIIPWVFGIRLYLRNKAAVLLATPLAIALAVVANNIGVFYRFWLVEPVYQNLDSISTLPFDLGLYPVVSCYFVHYLMKGVRPHVLTIAAALGLTLIEYIGFVIERVHYDNGWSPLWTFASYVIPFIIIYLYYRACTVVFGKIG